MKHRSHQTPRSRRASLTPAEVDEIQTLFAAGQWEALEAAARGLTVRHPGHPFGWKVLGVALEARGLFREAAAAAGRARRAAEAAAASPAQPDKEAT